MTQAPRRGFWGDRKPPENKAEIFKVDVVRNAAATKANGTTATVRIYGPIDSYGGFWGVSAKEVAEALDSLDAAVDTVQVRLNSPGGEAFEGVAIMNLLRAHRARIVAVVDGLAASAASVIATGADELVMSSGSQLMIHDASSFAFGDAAELERTKKMLDSVSNTIAAVYAEKAGGSTEDWRALMKAETWYSADEAVAAALADRTGTVQDVGPTETAGAAPEPVADGVEDAFDLSFFKYPGRSHAPAPAVPAAAHRPPAASADGSTPTHEERSTAVAFSDEQLTTMRQELGLSEDADEATIVAALSEALQERAETSPAPAPEAAAPTPTPTPAPGPATPGTMTIDASAWEEREARIKRLEAADTKRRREERDQVIDQAVRDGKFPVARKEHWVRLWDADPEGTRTVISGLAKDVVPVNELGHALDSDDIDAEFAHLFPTEA